MAGVDPSRSPVTGTDTATDRRTGRPEPAGTDHLLPAAGEVLATGWEPGVAVHDTVARNYLATLVDRLTSFARHSGGRVETVDRATLVDSASAYVFDNVAVCHGPLDGGAMAAVTDAAARFFPAERSWTLLSFTPTVAPAGMELVGHPPLMYRPVGPRAAATDGATAAQPAGLEVRRVRTAADLADFEAAIVEAYPCPAAAPWCHRRCSRPGCAHGSVTSMVRRWRRPVRTPPSA